MATITEGSQLYVPTSGATYELRELLGGGRIALVYRAEQIWPPEKKGHQVAIKLARTAAENGRLEAEKTLLEKVGNAPGFPRLEGWGNTREDHPRAFLVMEFIQGERVSSLAERSPGARLPEDQGIEMALQYARMLQTLHGAGYASTDRKLDDIYWIPQENGGRLVVLDWNVAAKGDASIQAADLYQFGLFWYELLLGSPPPPLRIRAFVGLESHPHWHNLTYGTRRILERALHPMDEWRYRNARELVEDLEFLANLCREDLSGLEQIAEQELEPRRLMTALDVIRVRFPEVWSRWENRFSEAEKSLQDQLESLLNQGQADLGQGSYEQAQKRFKDARPQGDIRPEQALRIERWIRLARFAQGLPSELEKIFREQALSALIEVTKRLDEGKWQEAAEKFWGLLERAFLPAGKTIAVGFIQNCQRAREEHQQGRDPSPYLQEAHRHLSEAWPSNAQLFARVVGLQPELLKTSLRFLADEAMLRTTLWKAENARGRGNLKEAAGLYSQAFFYFNAIPYSEALKGQTGDLQKEKEDCERLANTLGEAQKDKKAGERFLAEGDFLQAKEVFERGLSRFPDSTGLPEWARGMGEGLVSKLRAGRRQAQLRLNLKEVLDLLEGATDSPSASPTTAGPAGKSRARKGAHPQPAEQKSPEEERLLDIALIRCRILLDRFPDDKWGQKQYRRLKDRLVRRIQEALESPQADRIEYIAHLVSLARKHFREELSRELQDWELRATLALRGEIDGLITDAQKRLGEGWQAKLEEVLSDWQKGHELLRRIADFQEVFDPQAVRAQEEKLEALYEQIKYLAQLQRDIAAEIGRRRAQIDAEEQRRREERRRAYFLAEDARKLLAKPEPWRRDLEDALAKAEEAYRLWPDGPEISDLVGKCKKELEDIDRKFSDALSRGEDALRDKRLEDAERALQEVPGDALLSEAQKKRLKVLQMTLHFEKAYSSAEGYLQENRYSEALEALRGAPESEQLTPEQIRRREGLRVRIVGEAHAQARKEMAAGKYEDAERILKSVAGAEIPDGVRSEQERLERFNQGFQELAANLATASQSLQEILQNLSQRPPALERPTKHLMEMSQWIETAPEELPKDLKTGLKKHIEDIEEKLWETRKGLHFWQVGLLAEVAACLALVGLLKHQVETRREFSSEEVSHEPGAEIA